MPGAGHEKKKDAGAARVLLAWVWRGCKNNVIANRAQALTVDFNLSKNVCV